MDQAPIPLDAAYIQTDEGRGVLDVLLQHIIYQEKDSERVLIRSKNILKQPAYVFAVDGESDSSEWVVTIFDGIEHRKIPYKRQTNPKGE